MAIAQDLAGQRFGQLTAISRAENRGRRTVWRFRCACGAELSRGLEAVRSSERCGKLISCGCEQRAASSARWRKHGHSRREGANYVSRTYAIWAAMKSRCENPNTKRYRDYGARGITVAPQWSADFQCFLNDVGERPAGLSLERIDNERGYEPGNCRWATREEQGRNTRTNVWVDLPDGSRMILKDYAESVGVKYITLIYRMRRLGVSAVEAGALPFGRKHSRMR